MRWALLWLACGAACGSAEPSHVAQPPIATAAGASDAASPDAQAALVALPAGVWRRDELGVSSHACVVRGDGRVACWGPNTYGEVGDEPHTPHPIPMFVPGIANAIAVGVGPAETCAILADGHVACWGGYDEKAAAVHRVDGIDDVVEIAVLSQRVCARKRDGEVWCWLPKKAPAAIAALGRARRIVAGFTFACTIGDDDRTHCIAWWAGKDNTEAYQVLDVTDAAGAIQLAASYNSTCAVLHDGRETCWTLTDSVGPPALAVVPIAGVHDAIDVVGNNSEMCVALRGGGVQCGTIGQKATAVTWAQEFRTVAIGTAHCGVHPAGDVVCWGSDYGPIGRYPQIGAQRTPSDIVGLADAEQIALEDEKVCARRAGGRVSCWGDASAFIFTDVKVAHVTKLRSGHRFTCADTGGKTVCWGVKSWQACRRHSPHDGCRLDPLATPTPTPSPLDIPNAVTLVDPCAIDSSEHVKCKFSSAAVVDVSGIDHAISASPHCAVSRAGSVACWPAPSGSTPLAATPVEGITDAVQIVSGTAHHCVRTKAGGVACWGKNRLGQLGDGTRTSRTTPAPVRGLANVVEIAAGLDFTCARTKAGAVSCWGANASGALGDGSGRDHLLPVSVHGVDDAVELAAMNLHACVRRKNHRVACWGYSSAVSSGPEEHVTVPEPETIE